MSLFYNRKQYALRAALFYSGSQLGNAFGGLLAIAILELDGRHGLEGWRWVRSPKLSTGAIMLTEITALSGRGSGHGRAGSGVCLRPAQQPRRLEKSH